MVAKFTKEQAVEWLLGQNEDSLTFVLMAKGVDVENDKSGMEFTEIGLDDLENVQDGTYYDFELWSRHE